MSVAVEKLEKNMAKLTIEVSAEELEKAIQGAYQKQKNRISIPGFRKGKAPRKMIEKMYGVGVFYEDAANALIPEAYSKALDECEETIVSQPSIAVTQLESGKPFIFTAEVALKPEVTLGEYKGLEVPKADLEVTEEEIAGELRKEQEENSRVLDVDDRAVADGDKVTLDFEGFVDGEAFDGGKGTDYPLTIGSGSFIPGFEEQLVGANIGEEKEVNVTFPEDYQAAELAGKPAVFKCTVKKIEVKELPELDDEFAKDVSEFPDTSPSASFNFTIIIPKYTGSNTSFSACSSVIPFDFLNSYNSLLYLAVSIDTAGSIIFVSPISIFLSFANFLTSSSLPINITLAYPSFFIISAASNILTSVASGNTIVFISCFALCFICSMNDIFYHFLSSLYH